MCVCFRHVRKQVSHSCEMGKKCVMAMFLTDLVLAQIEVSIDFIILKFVEGERIEKSVLLENYFLIISYIYNFFPTN